MNRTVETLFNLIRYEIFGGEYSGELSELADDRFVASVCSLAEHHDVTHLVADAIGRLSVVVPNEKLANAIAKEQLKAIFRSERIDGELEALCTLFETEKIEYLPLKGAVIRELYPEKWMRTSCDIDILVRKNDLERAGKAVVEKLGYAYRGTGDHDVGYTSPSGIHFELHFALNDDGRGLKIFENVWKYTHSKVEGEFRRYMNDDMFYLYHVAHMAKHVENGGCGIKPFLDLCFIERNGDLLKKNGMELFDAAARKLSAVWFLGGEADDLSREFADYVLRAGVYGNVNNAVAVGQVKRGGRVRYIMSRVFLPYNQIKYQYPVLQKHRWLVPIYQVRRWFRLIFKGGVKRSANEFKVNAEMPRGQSESIFALFGKLGI